MTTLYYYYYFIILMIGHQCGLRARSTLAKLIVVVVVVTCVILSWLVENNTEAPAGIVAPRIHHSLPSQPQVVELATCHL
jgi:hypothetical protein